MSVKVELTSDEARLIKEMLESRMGPLKPMMDSICNKINNAVPPTYGEALADSMTEIRNKACWVTIGHGVELVFVEADRAIIKKLIADVANDSLMKGKKEGGFEMMRAAALAVVVDSRFTAPIVQCKLTEPGCTDWIGDLVDRCLSVYPEVGMEARDQSQWSVRIMHPNRNEVIATIECRDLEDRNYVLDRLTVWLTQLLRKY